MHHSVKILVADHNSETLNMFSTIATSLGISTPIKVTDGGLALAVFKDRHIDLAFVDFGLPTVDGLTVLKEFKKLNPNAFVIMLSVAASEENVRDALAAGASGFVAKPFQPHSIIKLIHKYELKHCKDIEKIRKLRKMRPGPSLEIVKILSKLIKHHELAILEFEGSDEKFTTFILSIDEEKNTVQLDEIIPPDGHELAIKDKYFKVSMQDHGIPVEFRGKIKTFEEYGNSYFYTIDLPEKILQNQKRAAFRVKLDFCDKVAVNFIGHERHIENAHIVDISFNGICMIVPKLNLEEQYYKEDVLDPVKFSVEGKDYEYIVRIKRIFYDKAHNQTLVAGFFEKLTKGSHRKLVELVCALDRSRIENLEQ